MAADKKDETMFGMPLKYVALLTLVVQNSMLVLIMKYSREGVAKSDLYLASTAEPQNKGAGVTQILSALFGKEAESWKMMVPAALCECHSKQLAISSRLKLGSSNLP
ncbi:hypothetical protein HDU99_007556, partial [Rhizoclosmatium hyalinum]